MPSAFGWKVIPGPLTERALLPLQAKVEGILPPRRSTTRLPSMLSVLPVLSSAMPKTLSAAFLMRSPMLMAGEANVYVPGLLPSSWSIRARAEAAGMTLAEGDPLSVAARGRKRRVAQPDESSRRGWPSTRRRTAAPAALRALTASTIPSVRRHAGGIRRGARRVVAQGERVVVRARRRGGGRRSRHRCSRRGDEFGSGPGLAKARWSAASGAAAAGSRNRTVPSGAALVAFVEKCSRPELLCSTYCGR